jgi:8-oxo-dGTP pyrophosphatase MutT (NUDIX family)
MAHIHTEPNQHDFTASAFIVRDDMDEPRVLLHMHRKLGRLLQPGGHIELHEHPWDSIAHELQEETGYMLADVEVLQPELRITATEGIVLHPQPLFVNTHAFPEQEHFHTDLAYLLLAHDKPKQPPDEDESQDLRWLSRAAIEALSDELIYANTREVCLDIFDRFLDLWKPVAATNFSANNTSGK